MPLPPFTLSDDLEATSAQAWAMLLEGVTNRQAAAHHPVVATGSIEDGPRLRTVILRFVDADRQILRFHTDLRAQKIAELRADPRIALLVYDGAAKIQIRLEGQASLHSEDGVADFAWQASQRMSRACYATMPAPGTAIGAPDAYRPGRSDAASEGIGRPNFCAVQIKAARLEWLYLLHSGHRRAQFDYAPDGSVTSNWLVP
jgi:pyridoxamine 5'-phosphate oxidase